MKKKKCFYELFSRIEDNSNLAGLFNNVLGSLNIVRMMSAPTTFGKEEDRCSIELFYESCLWEMYLHGVISKLNQWKDVLNEYETEFDSNWKYYALSKRLESINEYGGEDSDYNDDGSVRSINLSDEDLKHYTVIGDIVQDDWRDIVQETKPEHLYPLCTSLLSQAKVSVTDIFKQVSGKEITTYKEGKNGNMIPMTFADKMLLKVSDEVNAENLSSMVLCVCHRMQLIVEKIKSLNVIDDNKEALSLICLDIECLLALRFKDEDTKNNIKESE